MQQRTPKTEARSSTRRRQRSQAILIETPPQGAAARLRARVHRTETKDLSDTGACVLTGSRLAVGQRTQLRVGTQTGLGLSVVGRVVRWRGPEFGQGQSEWGIAFEPADAALLQRYEVFEQGFQAALAKHNTTAAIISRDPQEMMRWIAKLDRSVTKLLIPKTSPGFLANLQRHAPHLQIRTLL